MLFIALFLVVTSFFTGFTYSEFKYKNGDISIAGDSANKLGDDETYYNLNLDIPISAKFIEPVTPKGPITKFVEPTSYRPMLTYEDINYPNEPKTVEDFEKVFLYMINQDILELELYYSDTYEEIFGDDATEKNNNYDTAFSNVGDEYPDLFSNICEYSYSMWNNGSSCTFKLKLSSDEVDDITALTQEYYFQQTATKINNALHEKNYITDDMTQKEIAKELFAYVTRTLKYDTDYRVESYTGYGAVKNNKAVCVGYTALYNYLLKLNGIDCKGQVGEMLDSGNGHIWTVAILDGETCYIDVTHGDPIPDEEGYSNYEYFDISKEDLSKDRTGVE